MCWALKIRVSMGSLETVEVAIPVVAVPACRYGVVFIMKCYCNTELFRTQTDETKQSI